MIPKFLNMFGITEIRLIRPYSTVFDFYNLFFKKMFYDTVCTTSLPFGNTKG